MKPLTIEQLKSLEVGDWVWVIDKGFYKGSGYQIISCQEEDEPIIFLTNIIHSTKICEFKDYAKTWLAYKNKEQAEGKDDEIRKQTAKEIFDEVIEACTVQLNAAEVDEFDNRYSEAWGRYWEGKISGVMNCRADILNIAKKYGVEVDW